MTRNYDQSIEINHNPNCYVLDHPYRVLIIGGSGSGKTNALLNLTKNQLLIKFIYISMIHLNRNINCLLMEEKK